MSALFPARDMSPSSKATTCRRTPNKITASPCILLALNLLCVADEMNSRTALSPIAALVDDDFYRVNMIKIPMEILIVTENLFDLINP